MEEVLTGAQDMATAADTGAANGSLLSGEQLYEKYEAGSSIEELNELIAESSSRSDETDTAQDESGVTSDEQEEEASGDVSSPDEAASDGAEQKEDSRQQAVQKQNERTFTQRDVDYLIGKKTSEVTRKHSALLDDLSALLGVDRDKVTEEIRRQKLEREAEARGIEDKELYARTVQLEEENRRMISERQAEENRRAVGASLDKQVQNAYKAIPGFDMDKAVGNEAFRDTLQAIHQNPQLREQAVELAYRAVFAGDIARAAAQAERERVVSSVKAGQVRISEGATGSGTGAVSKIDVGKLTDEQIADLAARAANGEKIVL